MRTSRVELSEGEKCKVVAPRGYYLRAISGQGKATGKHFAMSDTSIRIDLIKRMPVPKQ